MIIWNPSFLEKEALIEEHPMETLLRHWIKGLANDKSPVMLFLRHVQYKIFFHGFGVIDEKSITLLFFKDSCMCLLVHASLKTGKADMLRLKKPSY